MVGRISLRNFESHFKITFRDYNTRIKYVRHDTEKLKYVHHDTENLICKKILFLSKKMH